jgi:hypothetical protein
MVLEKHGKVVFERIWGFEEYWARCEKRRCPAGNISPRRQRDDNNITWSGHVWWACLSVIVTRDRSQFWPDPVKAGQILKFWGSVNILGRLEETKGAQLGKIDKTALKMASTNKRRASMSLSTLKGPLLRGISTKKKIKTSYPRFAQIQGFGPVRSVDCPKFVSHYALAVIR